MTFAEKLKQLRERAGLSQEKLAEKLNVSRQVVTKWENESGIPRIENLKALADFFHVTIDELLGRTEASNADLMTEYRRTIEALREYSQTTVHLLEQAIILGSRMAAAGQEIDKEESYGE
ncbi:MAG: helix-turn-helix transcriptional regulator [Lachnospiraceae bacterium]|nr:helix-turn-helix transcriptional regulator [Lachnospiraceae bacterium]